MDLGCESELDGTEMAETNNNNGEENGGRCFNFSVRGCIWGKDYCLHKIFMVWFLKSNVLCAVELFFSSFSLLPL